MALDRNDILKEIELARAVGQRAVTVDIPTVSVAELSALVDLLADNGLPVSVCPHPYSTGLQRLEIAFPA